MSHLAILLLGFFALGAAIALYAWLAPQKRVPPPTARPDPAPWQATTDWTAQAGDEFLGLSEAARCDLVFAVSDLQDERSEQLLVHALDDPSDAVALAAAHSLAARGRVALVSEYAQTYPGQRAERLLDTLALLQ
jgi:hypothetical protein